MSADRSRDELTHDGNDDGRDEEVDESRLVICDYCDTELELSDEELAQGWYLCSECGELSHLGEPDDEAADSWSAEQGARQDAQPRPREVPEFAHRDPEADWVQLKTSTGPEEAALEVAFLRTNGVEAFTWQEGAGHAYGLTVGLLGASHIMVREDQLELARSIIESEAEIGPGKEQAADEALSDTSRAVMGMAALALNPLGVGLATGASQLLGRHHVDEEADRVECGHCGETVSLSARQSKQGWFFCPHCHGLGQLEEYVTCLSCGSELELTEEEWDQGWYRCPECDQMTQLVSSAEEEANPLTNSPADNAAYLVDCAQCGTPLELSDEEVAQGHFICPECGWLIQLGNYVLCPVCQTQLVLDEAEREQGWYRCQECDQVTQL